MGKDKPTYEELELQVQALQRQLKHNVANHVSAEMALSKSEKRMRSLLENSPDLIWSINAAGEILSINHSVNNLEIHEILGRHFTEFDAPEYYGSFKAIVAEVFKTGLKQETETGGPGKDGSFAVYKHRIIPMRENGIVSGAMIISEEITEQKQAQEELRENVEKYRSLVENTAYAIVILDGLDILYVNQGALNITGCRSTDEMTGRKFTDFVAPEHRDLLVERGYKRQKGEDVPNQYEFQALRRDGASFPAEISIGRITYRGKEARQGIIRDISDRKHAEQELQNSLDKLRKAMKGIVQAMAKITEIKDPYTAGHQRRVARLASAIAHNMGLSQEQVEAVRLAGLIHDLGKIYIPHEILNKPTPLAKEEYTTIQAHARAGYDILKTTEFPWSITDVIHQHHERYDGSGYPQKLNGQDILIEARILAVADTVEAMSFDRPYRAAPGQDMALQEISSKRGILYDPQVVDTCIKILTDNEFRFE